MANLIFEFKPMVKQPKTLIIKTGANAINWQNTLNTSTIPTYGGQVIQILSCKVHDFTITGNTAYNVRPKGLGSKDLGPGLEEIRDWFLEYMEIAGGVVETKDRGLDTTDQNDRDERAIRFSYPERGWDFRIQVLEFSPFELGTTKVATEWSIKAHVIPKNAPTVLDHEAWKRMTGNTKEESFRHIMSRIGFEPGNKYSDPKPFFNLPGNSLAQYAREIGNRFEVMMAAFAADDFNGFKYDLTEDGLFNKTVDEYYQEIYGTPYLVGGTGSVASGGVGGYSGSEYYDVISQNQNRFCAALSSLTGIKHGTLATVCISEEPKLDRIKDGRHTQVDPQGDFNFLNVDQGDSYTTSYALDPGMSESPESAADLTDKWIRNRAAPSIRDPFLNMSDKSVEEQLVIWQNSPWASNHYEYQLPERWRTVVLPSRKEVPAALGGGGIVPSGAKAALMEQVVNNNKITYDYGRTGVEATDVKRGWGNNGGGNIPLDKRLYILWLWLAQAMKVNISCVLTDHPMNVAGTDRKSQHSEGMACDLNKFNDRPVEGTNSWQLAIQRIDSNQDIVNMIRQIGGPSSQGFVSWCQNNTQHVKNLNLFENTGHDNHLHIGLSGSRQT